MECAIASTSVQFTHGASPSSLCTTVPSASVVSLGPSNRSQTDLPLASAVESTNGLNDDPGWRSICVARLRQLASAALQPPVAYDAPPYIALIRPVPGSIEINDDTGFFLAFFTAASKTSCSAWSA